MVKNKEEKSERRSSVTGGDGNGNRPNSSTTDRTTNIVPPARNGQQEKKQHQSPRQERQKWAPSQSPNVLRNRRTRRSSLSTIDILNGLVNDSAQFDLIVGAGESATNIDTCTVDDTAGSDHGDKGALGRHHQVEHIYGVLNDVDSAQKEESVQHTSKTQRPNTRDGGQVKRNSSLTTLGELCRRSSLDHLDLFGNSMLLNDSFVFKLQGSETVLPAAGEENNDQASTERPAGAGASTSSTNKRSPSRRVSFEGGRGESLGGGGTSLAGEKEQSRKKKYRPMSRSSSLSSLDVKQQSMSTLGVLDDLLKAPLSSQLYVTKASDLPASSDLPKDNNHKGAVEKEEEKLQGKAASNTCVMGKTLRLLRFLACVVLIAIVSCMYKYPNHHPVDFSITIEQFAKASSGVLPSGWRGALGIVDIAHVDLVDSKVLSDASAGNQNVGGRGLVLESPEKRRSPLKIHRPKFKRRRKQRRPNWKRQKKRNKKVSLPADVSPQSMGRTRMFTSLYLKWTKGRGRRRRRRCATRDASTAEGGENSYNDDSKGNGSSAHNIFGRDSSGVGKGKGKGQGLNETQPGRVGSGSDDFALKESESSKGGKVSIGRRGRTVLCFYWPRESSRLLLSSCYCVVISLICANRLNLFHLHTSTFFCNIDVPYLLSQGRRNFFGRSMESPLAKRNIFSQQRVFSAEEESFDDSKAQDSKAEMARGKRAVPCPTNACMSTPCDGGYGALLCVPQNAVYSDIECDDHFTDLCIASSHVDDALSMGAVCGTCPTDTPSQKARKLPCSSYPPMVTETTITLDQFKTLNLFNILAARNENTLSTDLHLYNVTKEISSFKVGDETFFLEGGGDVVSFRIEECDASVTIFSNGTVLVSGSKEPCEVCFDYTVISREEGGGILMLGMATEIGTHCINIRPHRAYTATVSEIDDLPNHSITLSILSGFTDDDSGLGGGSIVKIIVPSGTDEEDGTAQVIVPRAGDVLVLRYGNMTIDPVTGMMLYTPNPSLMESLGEGDESYEYFDYVSVDQDGTSSMERVTIRVVGEGGIAPPIAEDNTYGRTVEELNNAGGIIVGEIMENDSDPDGALGELTITSITPVGGDGTVTPTAGTVYKLENGNFTIDPDTGLVKYTPDPAKVTALSGAPGSILTDTLT